MATLTVHSIAGESVGSVDVDTEVIASSINKQLLHDAVVMYQANARQGTRSAKTRGEVSGSNKKMYRQKGTGNARAGSKRTNIRRGGGVARTIKPRDYSYRLNKKALRLATRMAIRSKIDDGETVIVDKLEMDAPKTAQVAGMLKALGLSDATVLLVTADQDNVVYRSGRNIRGLDVTPVRQLNALSVLRPKRMVVTRDAIDRIVNGSFAADAADAASTTAAQTTASPSGDAADSGTDPTTSNDS